VEQGNVYRQLELWRGPGGRDVLWDETWPPGKDGDPLAPWWMDPRYPNEPVNNIVLVQTKIPTFLCPSDDPYSNTHPTLWSLYTHCGDTWFHPCGVVGHIWGLAWPAGDEIGKQLGRTNYVGCAGTMGDTSNSPDRFRAYLQYIGLFTDRSKNSLGQVLDGTSNTLLFGETRGGNSRNRRTAFSWMGCGSLPTNWGLPPSPYEDYYQFSSAHVGVVRFCFADGSVRALKQWNDPRYSKNWLQNWYVLQELAGYRDGGTRDPSVLLLP
jgi:hypothetical protein